MGSVEESITTGPRAYQADQDLLEPLAIIGYALEYPQDADTPEGFWRVLTERRNVMTKWPEDRFNLDAFYHQDGGQEQQKYVPGAHFLKGDLGAFDASFFGISATEAMAMDVQQRKLLETAYHALENAGIPMEKVYGSKTGVYSGSMADDYQQLLAKDIDTIPKYSASGVAKTMVANRLSWFYNLRGPSISMDSACSSSLMAFDFACQGLRNRDCSMAVVTGSSLAIAPDGTLSLMNMSFLSPQGRCHSFDARADGYSRGEGFGVVLVKRMGDALRDGDPIRAVVRSTGSNQDGRTPGVTQPSREMQAELIRDTYKKAGLSFRDTRFFEAHGTGTPLGDPIEADAIGSVFRTVRSKEEPLYVGALKANVGHLEGGSGIAGVIKAIMVLEKGIIPPNANFESVNPRIDADFLNLKFPLECTPWPCDGLRRASVASFGFGGSNSHVVLDDAYHYMVSRGLKGTHYTSVTPHMANGGLRTQDSRLLDGPAHSSRPPMNGGMLTEKVNGTVAQTEPCKLLVLSASDENGLQRIAELYEEYFQNHRDAWQQEPGYASHLAYTLSARRSSLPWKSFAVIDSVESLTCLRSSIAKPLNAGLNAKTIFVFTGQGAQYHGMGAGLGVYPSFTRTIERFDEELARLGCTWSVSSLLEQQQHGSVFDMDDPEYSQAATTALQMAQYDLLRDLGVQVALVVGHSSGEIAAAYAAGALGLRSACRVSYYRGQCASKLRADSMSSRPGAMMSVDLAQSEAGEVLANFNTTCPGQQALYIACTNSPRNVTISGDEASISLFQASLATQNIRTRKLNTGVAYHSPHMTAIAEQYAEKMGFLEPPAESLKKSAAQTPKRPIMISSVTGEYMRDVATVCTPDYWVRNLLSPVQFTKAMSIVSTAIGRNKPRKLGEPKLDVQDVVEIGPHAALRRPILDCLDASGVAQSKARYHSVLVRGRPAVQCLLNLVGELYTRGYAVRVQAANEMCEAQTAGIEPRFLPDLPSYPFNHTKSYWSESAISRNARRRNGAALHELLGVPVPDWNPLEPRWRKFFDLNETPWIGHHQVNGRIIFPAAGMVVMAIEGAAQVASREPGKHVTAYQIRDATFVAPISIGRNERAEAQLHMRLNPAQSDQNQTSFDFSVYSADGNDGWFRNCSGTVQVLFEKVDEGVSGRQARAAARQRESLYYQQKYAECTKNSTRPVPKRKMYDQFISNGLQYGEAFQPLDDMAWDGENTAVGSIKCFRWESDSELSHHDWQPHVVHPTLLDGAGQLPWVALTKGGEEQIVNGAAVTRIQYAWIANTGLSYPSASEVRACCETSLKGTRGTDSSIFGLDASGNLVLHVSHMETTAVGGEETSALVQNPKKICYEMAYRPDLDCLDSQQVKTLLDSGLEIQEEDSAVSFYEELELALFYFATSVLQGGLHTKGQREPHITKYVAWLNRQVQRYHAGDLPNGRPSWAARIQDSAAMEDLINRVEKTNAEGRFLVSVGRKLSSIIHGTTDPLEVMFQTGLAEEHYQAVCDQIICCKQLKQYLGLLSHKHPQLKVLEVGAGTGSITGHVLEGLDTRFSRYDYTDISASFFEQARGRLADPVHAAKMQYSVLDVERDPGEQGFLSNSYDVVVAAWVLHATRDLATTISNVRNLLKPGGKLVLLEITEPGLLRNGFAFGTLPGWWLSTEPEREWSPCLSATQWTKSLAENGFSGVDVVLPDFHSETCRENSILIATAVDDCDGTVITQEDEITLVTAPGSSLQESVAKRLQASFDGKGWVACSIVSIDDPALAQRTHTTFVFLMELDSPYLSSMGAEAFTALQSLLSRVQKVLWVSSSAPSSLSSAEQHMIRGLARVLFTEKPGLILATLSFESASLEVEAYSRLAELVFSNTFAANSSVSRELEFVEREGNLLVPRVFDADTINQEVYSRTNTLTRHQTLEQNPPLALAIPKSGLLDSIHWEEDARYTDEIGADEVEIQIQAMGVNFRDLLVMLGKYSASTVGCECAGIVTRIGANCDTLVPGDRVCACLIGCSRTHARCHYKLAVKIPESLQLSMAEAASLPCTGVTAYHSLITLARLGSEDSILIHSATGGTGQMAVQIAKSVGAEIFVTVGNEEKRLLARKLYDIPDDHIFSSRDVNFARDIHRMTDGRGVDVVLNSLSKEALLASWECIAPFGRFVELGKMDIESNSKLPMARFSKNVAFYAVAVDHLASQKPAIVGSTLRSLFGMMEKGLLKVASPLKTYAVSEFEDALRFIQSGTNTGKMVLTFSPSDIVPTRLRPRYSCSFDPDASYLIAGGLGGLGRSAARWMAKQGAKNLVLLSRSGPVSKAAETLVNELRESGVDVRTPRCDIADAKSLASTIASCADMPPFKGCLQATMVLQDALFETMTWEQWAISTRSKVQSTWNLHKQFSGDLSFFVMLSSVAGIAGSMGQSNYAAGNTFQDGLAAHRIALGQKAVSIDLGWMGDIGAVAENAALARGKEVAGDLAPIFEDEFLALLDCYCDPSSSADVNASTPEKAQPVIGLVTPAQFRKKGLQPPDWLVDRPLFRGLCQEEGSDQDLVGTDATDRDQNRDWVAELQRAAPGADATNVVVDALVQRLSKATSTPVEEIDRARPLHVYGVDSLLAVELRNWFRKLFKADVAIFDITGQASIERVAEGAVSSSAFFKKNANGQDEE